MSRETATDDRNSVGPDLGEALRPVVEEIRRGHDLLLGESYDVLLGAYREMTGAVMTLTRMRLGGTAPAAEASGLVDETERSILAALDRGVLITNIARELGVTRRTVNRRLERLRKLTGAETPFQLGRAAHALGWLSPDHSEPTAAAVIE